MPTKQQKAAEILRLLEELDWLAEARTDCFRRWREPESDWDMIDAELKGIDLFERVLRRLGASNGRGATDAD